MARKAKRPAAASNKSLKKSTSKSAPAKRAASTSATPRSTGKARPAKKAATVAANKPSASTAASKMQFFFPGPDFDPLIVDSKPKPFAGVVQCDTFEEAKHQALDALIEIIDRCEQRLWDLKRSASYEDYRRLSGTSGS